MADSIGDASTGDTIGSGVTGQSGGSATLSNSQTGTLLSNNTGSASEGDQSGLSPEVSPTDGLEATQTNFWNTFGVSPPVLSVSTNVYTSSPPQSAGQGVAGVAEPDHLTHVYASSWDPTRSTDWDNEKTSQPAILRIKRDIMSIYKEPPPGMFVVPDPQDMTKFFWPCIFVLARLCCSIFFCSSKLVRVSFFKREEHSYRTEAVMLQGSSLMPDLKIPEVSRGRVDVQAKTVATALETLSGTGPRLCAWRLRVDEKPKEEKTSLIHALITGPFDTPYEGGFFLFLFRCPPDYPIHPPRVKLITTGQNTVRFNPNFYRNGKVCLSILGTWTGPAWSPAQSISSVLISIQSLMTEKPYHNEPGFEQEQHPGDSKTYNECIRHETVRVAVCDMLEGKVPCPEALWSVMEKSFLEYYDFYEGVCKERLHLQGQNIKDPFGEKRGRFDYQRLQARLGAIHRRLREKRVMSNPNDDSDSETSSSETDPDSQGSIQP
ncbi:ubiquitin-conjugating enzyme E2 Z isoform X1 [Syngnathoides biaculeatus]|uniref:ubiquitin-conjugating enzyme E2 Z isoform X1 n=1 Tax=Syngnathoides biaculeatus TaxID=300417 RepID=UPI002ADE3908|nr:ubiquitin-conjugating enzyme E2 Z isoform X1 [Syngnathoides biaculeatus]